MLRFSARFRLFSYTGESLTPKALEGVSKALDWAHTKKTAPGMKPGAGRLSLSVLPASVRLRSASYGGTSASLRSPQNQIVMPARMTRGGMIELMRCDGGVGFVAEPAELMLLLE